MQLSGRKGLAAATSALAVLSIFSCAGLHAGDKITISDPVRRTEMPKAGPKLEELSKSYDFLDASKLKGPAGSFELPIAPAQNGSSAANLKKLEEYIDRKKNWIFETPKDKNSSSSSEAGQDADEAFGSSNNPFERRSSTVMENFFSERDRNTKQDSPNSEARKGNPAFDPGASLFKPKEDRFAPGSFGQDSSSSPNMEFNISSYFQRDRGNSESERRMNSPLEIRSSFAQSASNARADQKLERERQEEARQAEFQKLLQPRSLTPNVGGSFDVLNRTVDTTRQEVNPIAPRTFGSPLLGQVQSASSLPSINSSSSRPQIGGPSVAETIGMRNPIVNPLQSSTASPVIESSRFTPAPFVLDIQRRKF